MESIVHSQPSCNWLTGCVTVYTRTCICACNRDVSVHGIPRCTHRNASAYLLNHECKSSKRQIASGMAGAIDVLQIGGCGRGEHHVVHYNYSKFVPTQVMIMRASAAEPLVINSGTCMYNLHKAQIVQTFPYNACMQLRN